MARKLFVPFPRPYLSMNSQVASKGLPSWLPVATVLPSLRNNKSRRMGLCVVYSSPSDAIFLHTTN